MAPKAGSTKKTPPENSAASSKSTFVKGKAIITALAFVALAAFSSPISQLSLRPVWGSIPSALHHQKGITLITILAYISKTTLKRKKLSTQCRRWIPLLSYWTLTIQYVLFGYSFFLGPELGPVVVEMLTFYPVLYLSFISAFTALEDLDLQSYGTRIAEATPAVMSFAVFQFMERGANLLAPQLLDKADVFSRSGLQMLVASLSALMTRSSLLGLAVPSMVHTMFSNPHHFSEKTTKGLNITLSAHQYALLDRADSITGYLSVLENKKDGFRAMRCDHSLLGGEWQLTPERVNKYGQEVTETIYSVFTILEAVRLVKTEVYSPDDEKDALFIGLGVGTAPKAFIQHGIATTIVELDPKVHEYATKYFDLPHNHTRYLTDAVPWVAEQSKKLPESYDYIVHDVFTGGAEPTALFTIEFLQGLSLLLKEDGAIAINYAGDITLPPAQIILKTITSVFPSCRIFRDTIPEDGAETFLNMVVFCTKAAGVPITFRAPRNEDYLGSMARREFLPPDEGLEIDFAKIAGPMTNLDDIEILRKNNTDIIEEYHPNSAMRHWRIMRNVIPDAVWENW